MRHFILFITVVMLTSCAMHPQDPPGVIHEDAHRGGTVVAFSPSGELLASGGWSGNVQLWQLPGGDSLRHWRGHSDSVNGITFLSGERQVVTAGYDGVLQRRGIDGSLQQEVDGLVAITHMEGDAATDRLVTGHADGSVRLWKSSDFTLLSEMQLHGSEVKAVAIDPLRARYASSSEDSSVAVWTVD